LGVSHKEEGERQPVYLRYIADDDRYRTIEGHRRVEASRRARRSTIPAIILRDVTDGEAADLAPMLNTQRLDIEQSRLRFFNRRYQEEGKSVRQRAKLLGVSIGTISNWDNYGDLQDAGIPLRAFTERELNADEVREQLEQEMPDSYEVEADIIDSNDPSAKPARRTRPKPASVQNILEARRKRLPTVNRLVAEIRKANYAIKDGTERVAYELAYDEIGRALGLAQVFNVEQQRLEYLGCASVQR